MSAKIEVIQVNEGHEVEHVGKLRHQKKTIKVDRVWNVFYDGEPIGSIVYRLLTRERRVGQRTYVESRWKSPGWQSTSKIVTNAGSFPIRPLEAYSKKDAVDRIVRDYEQKGGDQL